MVGSFVVCLSGFVCCVVLWCRVGSECFVQRSIFSCARNVHLLELTVLPLWEARYYRATARYYRSGAVLRKYRAGRYYRAGQYYRVGARYYRAIEGAWGL